VSRPHVSVVTRIILVSTILAVLLGLAIICGLAWGSTGGGVGAMLKTIFSGGAQDETAAMIIWKLRLPRVLLAAQVGAALALGGLVFQALLVNPLAEPYILGISGGSAVGAIIGIIMGLSRFPGVSATAFAGSMATLGLVLMLSGGQTILKKDSLLLAGVMVNAFCSAVILFLLSITQDARLHNIIFWLMGDLSLSDMTQVGYLALMLIPCFILAFCLSHAMNLMLMGKETALTLGVHIRSVTLVLLCATSFMISATVAQCGLLGFVGLVMPHLLRIILGPDHRVLVPACILGGGAFMVACDLLARILPKTGEMPVGVITAIIGAPLFIYLLKRSSQYGSSR
jgi:cobalamin transport system permease protein